MLKTKFCDRHYKLKPEIKIYDLDGTIIDSSHRAITNRDGSINLDKWREMSTKDYIFKDDLLPMYWQLVNDYKMGHIIVICTARVLGEEDLNFIHSMGIYYDYIISRPEGNTTPDDVLKWQQCRHFFNLKQFKKLTKTILDDNINTLTRFFSKGCNIVNAKEWNSAFSK
jgi:hypothetical protein